MTPSLHEKPAPGSPERWAALVARLGRWSGRYRDGLFRHECRWSLVLGRLGLSFSILLYLYQHRNHGDYRWVSAFIATNGPHYTPLGALAIVLRDLPSAGFLVACYCGAWVAAILIAVGLLTRVAMGLSLLLDTIVICFFQSFRPGWHHAHNVLLLAQLAFLLANAGTFLSLDAWIRRRRRRSQGGHPAGDAPPAAPSSWPIFLAQMSVGLMLANAGYWKLHDSGWRWAFSDNLRIVIAETHLPSGHVPEYLRWIAGHEFAYRGVALAGLAGELSCFAVLLAVGRTRRLRALLGLQFVAFVIALKLFMGFSNLHWLGLAAFFIDWDHLASRIGRRPSWFPALFPSAPTLAHEAKAVPGLALAYGGAYLGSYLLIAFTNWPRFNDQNLNTYPFSRFAMYSENPASPPWSQHRPAYFSGVQAEIVGDLAEARKRELREHIRVRMYWVRTERDLAAVAAEVRRLAPQGGIKSVEVNLTTYRIPEYPLPLVAEVDSRKRLGAIFPEPPRGRVDPRD